MPFQKGNKLAQGGYHPEAMELKNDLIQRAKKSKKEINEALIGKAKSGDISAIREVYDRTVGKSKETVDMNIAGEMKIYIDPIIAKKNGIAPITEKDSN